MGIITHLCVVNVILRKELFIIRERKRNCWCTGLEQARENRIQSMGKGAGLPSQQDSTSPGDEER